MRQTRIPWGELLMRVFREDVLQCPCGGRRVVLAFVNDKSLYRGGGRVNIPIRHPAGRGGLPIDTQDLRSMLERIRGIRHARDLDLLVFFHRHPCALLTGEQLVAYVGYDREQVAKSLDGLIEAGLLTRFQNPSHTARLYELKLEAVPGGLLLSLLKIAATRQGRLEVMRLLGSGPGRAPSRQPPTPHLA
jgi:DNA-binding MarR family transcriptional regulator